MEINQVSKIYSNYLEKEITIYCYVQYENANIKLTNKLAVLEKYFDGNLQNWVFDITPIFENWRNTTVKSGLIKTFHLLELVGRLVICEICYYALIL